MTRSSESPHHQPPRLNEDTGPVTGGMRLRLVSFAGSGMVHVGVLTIIFLVAAVSPPTVRKLPLVELLSLDNGDGETTASQPKVGRSPRPGSVEHREVILAAKGGASPAPVTPRIEGRLKSPARQGNDEPVVPADLIAPASRASDPLGSAKVAVVPSGGQQGGRTGSTSANPIDTAEVAKEFGADSEGSSILGSGDAVRRPQYRTNPLPEYPEVARRRGYEGVVLLKVRILPDGTIGDIQVERSSSYKLLDEAAINTVKRWTFVPAQRNGIPIPIWATIPIRFSLFSS